MNIKNLNDCIEKEYERDNINLVHDCWYPLMKYDETYGNLRSINNVRFISLGLNPSLTEKFAKHIHHNILNIKENYDFKNERKFGQLRFESYKNNKEKAIFELIEYQSKLKYDPKEQILYFNYLSAFFKEINKTINFTDHVFHYDFCQIRHTDSKEMDSLIDKNYDLFTEHLNKVIDIINPEIIFVFNAWLSKLLRNNGFFSSKKIDNNHGCYFLNKKGNSNTKVILANQLSGGATSEVYRELMIWNVKRILKSK